MPIGHFTHTAESANVEVQNVFQGRNNITFSTNFKNRRAAGIRTSCQCKRLLYVELKKNNNPLIKKYFMSNSLKSYTSSKEIGI